METPVTAVAAQKGMPDLPSQPSQVSHDALEAEHGTLARVRPVVPHGLVEHERRVLRQALAEYAGCHVLDAGFRHEPRGGALPLDTASLHEAQHLQHALLNVAHLELLRARLLHQLLPAVAEAKLKLLELYIAFVH